MSRYVLIRRDNGEAELVAEADLPTEAELHRRLTEYPQLIPAQDLGLERPVTIGHETSLESGYADLVLIDALGRVCLVEVKKQGNPDTRQVVAQLLDYAAALWGSSIEEFEQRVLRGFLDETDTRSLQEFLSDAFAETADDDAEAVSRRALEGLEQTLDGGAFTLVVAAPLIPPRVQNVIEYLNAQGQRLFGLEVSYFRGPAECFVPRVVARPRVAETSHVTKEPKTREEYLPGLPIAAREATTTFLEEAPSLGADIQWTSYGFRARVKADRWKVIATFDSSYLYVMTKAGKTSGLDQAPFDSAREALDELGAGQTNVEWFGLRLKDATKEQIEGALDITRGLITSVRAARQPELPG